MRTYADTSFLVCLYVNEAGRSESANRYMRKQGEALPFTPWHRLEVRNAIRARVRIGFLNEREGREIFRQLEADLDEAVFLLHQPLDWTACLKRAESVGMAHAQTMNVRASDLFHVGCALEIGLKEFLTFDVHQKTVANAAGLKCGV